MTNFKHRGIAAWFSSRIHVRSIRGQLTLGLTATLVPMLALGFYASQEFVRFRVYRLTEKRLSAQAELISYGLRQWGRGTAQLVEALTLTPSFRDGRVDEIQSTLSAISAENPDRFWRFWSASQRPQLLAFSGAMTPDMVAVAQGNQASREYFQAALRGHSTYEVVLSKTTGRACLNVAEPVFRASPARHQLLRNIGSLKSSPQVMSKPVLADVSGVVVLCLPLASLGEETGLIKLFGNERLSLLANDNQRDFMTDPNGFESAVILVSNSGQLLFPDVDWSSDHIPNIQELANTSLPSLLPLARRAMRGEEIFTTVAGNGHRYLALTARVDSAWSLILLLNERTATADVNAVSRVLALVSGFTLLAVLVVIAYRSRAISRPLSIVGSSLRQISKGNFDVQFAIAKDDEIGDLLRNVQSTADRLKRYLREVTSFAVTQKQIDTAKSIQQDFLLANLPSSPFYEVAAISRPALDIGADWYDMVDAGDYAVFVVADVCDKGVPSALYMSVFRSLIRSKLLERLESLSSSSDVSEVIRYAIEQTNSYMAVNHNSSMMFATLYIAALNKTNGLVSSICAGHESPLLLNAGGTTLLDGVSGPAIGLFEGASYSVFTFNLCPGDAILIYSDGLIDARNPDDEGWGLGRLRQLLADVHDCSPSQLMKIVIDSVDDYMNVADQFDDLTVMALRWLGT
jgi:serine phosphatase RsbU (regulator of sigma subunit)